MKVHKVNRKYASYYCSSQMSTSNLHYYQFTQSVQSGLDPELERTAKFMWFGLNWTDWSRVRANSPLTGNWRIVGDSAEHESSSGSLLRPYRVHRKGTTPLSHGGSTVGKAVCQYVVLCGIDSSMPSVCEVIRVRGDAVQPRACQSGKLQIVSVGDGLTRKPTTV